MPSFLGNKMHNIISDDSNRHAIIYFRYLKIEIIYLLLISDIYIYRASRIMGERLYI